jgi:DNA-directed RNA polymerase specialized sigma24 family protein
MTHDYVTPGDRLALADRLFDSHYEDLFGYLYRLVDDRDRAAELAQATIIAMVRERSRAPANDEPRGVMYRYATRLALGQPARWPWSRQSGVASGGAGLDVESSTVATAFGRPNALQQALQALPQLDRALVLLHGRYNLSLPEIAQAVCLSLNAARERLVRAQAQFYTLYEQASHEQT